MPRETTIHLRRHYFLPDAGGGTVFCTMTHDGKTGPALAFLTPGQYPEFEGDEAWFRVLWHSARRREFLRQVDGKSG